MTINFLYIFTNRVGHRVWVWPWLL